jgi:hypothetical protein
VIGIVTAAVAWYTSSAGVVNGMASRQVLPVGGPLWRERPPAAAPALGPELKVDGVGTKERVF